MSELRIYYCHLIHNEYIELWSLMFYFAIFAAVIIFNIIKYILVTRH